MKHDPQTMELFRMIEGPAWDALPDEAVATSLAYQAFAARLAFRVLGAELQGLAVSFGETALAALAFAKALRRSPDYDHAPKCPGR